MSSSSSSSLLATNSAVESPMFPANNNLNQNLQKRPSGKVVDDVMFRQLWQKPESQFKKIKERNQAKKAENAGSSNRNSISPLKINKKNISSTTRSQVLSEAKDSARNEARSSISPS